ncbi:hypothetical protein ACLOJK_034441 [Asimina triloba]
MEEEEFQMREPTARSCASSTWSGDDDTIQAEEVIFAEDGSCFCPLTGIGRESTLPLALCHRGGSAPRHRLGNVVRPAVVLDPSEDEWAPGSPINLSDLSEEAPLEGDGVAGPGRSPAHTFDEVPDEATPAVDIAEEAVVAPTSPIRSVGGGGSAGSVGVLGFLKMSAADPRLEAREAKARFPSLLGEQAQLLSVSHGGGIGDLNVDNVDRPLGLLGADALILFSSFFGLVSLGHAERSPSSVHRAGSSGEGASKGADAASRGTAKPVAPVEGGAIKAVVPDSDKGSGDNFSMG